MIEYEVVIIKRKIVMRYDHLWMSRKLIYAHASPCELIVGNNDNVVR